MSEILQCLNCGSIKGIKLFTTEDVFDNLHIYYRCTNCSLVFLWPLPDKEMFSLIYDSDYYGEGQEEKFQSSVVVRLIDFFSRYRASRICKLLPFNARIIDVGCGNGRLLEHLFEMNKYFELYGVEINARAVKRASKRLKGKAEIYKLENLDQHFTENSIDGVVFIHVFEHMPDPSSVMDQLEAVVRTFGIVMMVIPNIHSRQANKYKGKWFHLDPPRHLHFYPLKLLVEEMGKRGFVLVSEAYSDLEQNPFGAFQSMLNTLLTKRDVLYERLKGNKRYAPGFKNVSVLLMKLLWFFAMPFCVIMDFIDANRAKGASMEIIFRKVE